MEWKGMESTRVEKNIEGAYKIVELFKPLIAREDKDGEEVMAHTASMESCIADLDLLMCSRNRSDDAEDRRARVQAERDKLTEKLRAKTQEAKERREARTGEIAPITEEIIDDGAGDL